MLDHIKLYYIVFDINVNPNEGVIVPSHNK